MFFRRINTEELEAERDVAGLLQALGHKKPDVRERAAESLRRMDDLDSIDAMGKLGDPAAVGFLIALVERGDRDSGPAAVRALGEIGNPQVAGPGLLKALRHDSSEISLTAADVLREMGGEESIDAMGKLGDPAAVEFLIALVECGDRVSGPAAVQALAEIGDPRAVASLIDRLRMYLPSYMREAAARALGRIPDVRSVVPLIAAMSDDHSAVRGSAYWSLLAIGEPAVKGLIGALDSDDDHIVGWAVSLLGRLGRPAAANPLVKLITRKPDLREDIRSSVHKALKAIGEASVDPLVGALRAGDGSVRLAVLEPLFQLNNARSVEPIIEVLADIDGQVRRAAAEGLGRLRDSRAVAPLVDLLRDELVGDTAAQALGKIGDPRAVPALIQALAVHGSDVAEALGEIGDVRAVDALLAHFREGRSGEAAAALAKLGDPRAAEPLLRVVVRNQDPEDLDRSQALTALYDIGPAAVDAFLAILSDERSDLRARAAYQLGAAGDVKAVEPLIDVLGVESLQEDAAVALGYLGDPRAVPALINLLLSSNRPARTRAARALGQIGDSRAVAPLIAVLKEDPDPYLRMLTVEALGEIGDARAVDTLTTVAVAEEDLRTDAAKALGKIGDERAVGALAEILNDASLAGDTAVIEALGRIGSEKAFEPLLVHFQSSWMYDADAAWALGEIGGPDVVEPLIDALSSDECRVREACAGALGMVGDERAIDPLVDALADADAAGPAAESLGKIDHPRAFQALIDAVQSSTHHGYAAAEVLGDLGDERAVEPLIHALDNAKEAYLRSTAAEALGKLGILDAHDALIYALDDEVDDVRIAAARALGSLADEAAVEALETIARDEYESASVREAATVGLSAITAANGRKSR